MGGRSRVAAQMLAGKGFKEVYNVRGGIKAWEGEKAWGPKELNLDLVRGDETPSEMVVVAYGLEDGLGRFYEKAEERANHHKVVDLLTRLAKVEQDHKNTLSSLYAKVEPGPGAKIKDLAKRASELMEGGLSIESFLKENDAYLENASDMLHLAMMIETQSLDLYHRFAEKCLHEETKQVLYNIATQEKAHLTALGRMLEELV